MKNLFKAIVSLSFAAVIFTCMSLVSYADEGDYIVMFEDEPVILYDSSMKKLTDKLYLVDSADKAAEFSESEDVAFVIPDEVIEIPEEELIFEEIESTSSSESVSLLSIFDENYPYPFGANDTLYDSQWHLKAINAPYAWQKGYNGEGITVAVIDSGLNIDHLDLKSENIIDTINVMSGQSPSDVTDTKAHGTFVTGLIAASVNNSLCASGITENVNLIPIKVTDTSKFNISTLFAGLQQAINKKCDIINMSMGFAPENTASIEALKYLIDKAYDANIIVVAAAGNNGDTSSGSEYHYPASFDNVVSVGSLGRPYTEQDEQNGIEMFSKIFYNGSTAIDIAPYEPSLFTQHNDKILCSAPGYYMYSLGTSSKTGMARQDGGTSFAVPQVTAAAAIARQINPYLTVDEFIQALKDTVKDVYTEGYDEYTGYGMLDIKALIDYIEDSIKVKDLNITSNQSENGISVSASFDPLHIPTKFVVAVYDNGRLIGTSSTVADSGSSEITINLDCTGTEAAIFAWKDDNSMFPLCDSVKIQLT